MVNTPSQAIIKANSIKVGYSGMCLAFVQDCYNAKAVEPSALQCWNNSRHKHVLTNLGQLGTVPAGAPLFMTDGNPYGHVALYLGGGLMRTTNSATGRIHTDPVSLWVNSYGYRLQGWTEDIEGQLIPGLVDNPTIKPEEERGNNDMQCIIQPNDENRLEYFDGHTVHPLTHPDQVVALDMVAQQCGVKLPHFKLGSKNAPWATRLHEAVGVK